LDTASLVAAAQVPGQAAATSWQPLASVADKACGLGAALPALRSLAPFNQGALQFAEQIRAGTSEAKA